ncbi:hypothetical protein AB6815_23335, partial [Escherichia coli]
LKSPSYTKSVSWQHYRTADRNRSHWSTSKTPSYTKSVSWQHHPGRHPERAPKIVVLSRWGIKNE